MSAHEKKSLEVAANASLAKSLSYRIYENGKALRELTTKHGVILEDTPSDYFTEYMAAAKASLNKNAAEWCCPKPDLTIGFQKVLKHYYLQGLHQVVVNADFYITGKTYNAMSDHEKKSLEVAANASLAKSLSYRIYENGKALQELTTKHGVILEDTPSDYFTEYMAAAKASLNKNAKENKFFNEVYNSMKEFADIAVPFWSGAQMSNAKLGMAHAATLK